MQAPILSAVLRCTSCPCEELQLASLLIISALAAIPITWAAFSQVRYPCHPKSATTNKQACTLEMTHVCDYINAQATLPSPLLAAQQHQAYAETMGAEQLAPPACTQ